MNEFISKIVFPGVTLLAIVVFPQSLFAATTPSIQSEKPTAMFRSQMGCMSCHQSQSMRSESPVKKAPKSSR